MGNKLPNSKKVYYLGRFKPVALVFDEYDAGRPDVMFVIRVLESDGNFTLLDKNKVLEQHDFRIFATQILSDSEILQVYIMAHNK